MNRKAHGGHNISAGVASLPAERMRGTPWGASLRVCAGLSAGLSTQMQHLSERFNPKMAILTMLRANITGGHEWGVVL